MTSLLLHNIAQVSVERVLNSLPEGLLIALFAWLLLRLIGRQNAGTRFAVWFTALIAVVGISIVGGLKTASSETLLTGSPLHAQITIPEFWAQLIFAVWALLALIAIARIFAGLWQVWRIQRGCTEIAPSQLGPEVEELFRQQSTGRQIRLAVSAQVKVPAAIGFSKPVIVLPSWAMKELAPADLQPILIHELTHLRRCDDWTNLLQKLVRAVFFFHPAVWWIDARMSLEREMACDDAVLANTGNPRAYASCLIDLLEKSCARRGWAMAQAAVHRAHELSLRIKRILDAKHPGTTRIWKPALALTGVVSLACFAVSFCVPRLVVFAPTDHTAQARITQHTDEPDLTAMRGMVVPASFHIPAPAAKSHRPAAKPKVTKAPAPSKPSLNKLTAEYRQPQMTSAMAMINDVKAPAKNAVPMMQMVVFIETDYVSYGQTVDRANPQANSPKWSSRFWQIVLIAPAQETAQESNI